MGISISSSGSFDNLERFLKRNKDMSYISGPLNAAGARGVQALQSVTPVDTAFTASQWTYEVVIESKSSSIVWRNSSMAGNTPVVVLLTFGHGTGTGGYVQGQDFINPALKPIFDSIANDVWKAVTSS